MTRPSLPAIATGAAILLGAQTASALEPKVEFGVGIPELTHVRIGAFVHPRLSIELYASNVVFNWLVGLSASGYFLGEARPDGPPRHALLVQGTVAMNPLAAPVRVRGGGETFASGLFANVGYALTTDVGFTFQATAGVLAYVEDTVAATPTVSVSVGWKF